MSASVGFREVLPSHLALIILVLQCYTFLLVLPRVNNRQISLGCVMVN